MKALNEIRVQQIAAHRKAFLQACRDGAFNKADQILKAAIEWKEEERK